MQINNNNSMITILETYGVEDAAAGIGTQVFFRMGKTEYLYSCTHVNGGRCHWRTAIYPVKSDRTFDGPAIFSIEEKMEFNNAVNSALGLNG